MIMYCVVARESLKKMNGNRGKLAAQAGHAYLHAFWDATQRWAELTKPGQCTPGDIYRVSGKAKKVCLAVDTVEELEALERAYRPVCGVSLVKDAGLTCFTEPTVTCLGIGPIADEDIGEDLKCLKLLL